MTDCKDESCVIGNTFLFGAHGPKARVHQIKKVPLRASSPFEPRVITIVLFLRVSSPLGAPFLFGAHGPVLVLRGVDKPTKNVTCFPICHVIKQRYVNNMAGNNFFNFFYLIFFFKF